MRLAPVLLAAVGVASLFTAFAAASVPLAVLLVSLRMPGRTAVERVAIAVMALFGAGAAVLTSLAVAGIRADARWVAAAYLVLAALAAALTPAGGEEKRRRHGPDAAALISFAAVALVLGRPLLGAPAERVSALLARSTDGGTHLQLVRAVLQEGGYIGLLPEPAGILPGLENYPSGWAGNIALVVELFLGPNPAPGPFVQAVSLLVVGLYALVALLATTVALEVSCAVSGRAPAKAVAAGTMCTTLATAAGASTLLLVSSSYAQIAATAALLASLLVVLTAPAAKKRTTLVLALLAVALFHTWYLLSPVLAALLLVHLAMNRPPWLHVVVAAVPAAAIAAYPVVTGPRANVQIAAAGGTASITMLGGAALVASTAVTVVALLTACRAGRPQRLLLVTPLVAGLLLVVAVVAFQESAGGGANYYAAKILYTVLTLAAVGGAATVVIALSGGLTWRPRSSAPVVAIVVAALGLSSFAMRGELVPQLRGEPPATIQQPALAAIFASHGGGIDPDTDIWILDGCRPDRHTNQFVNSLYLRWDQDRLATFNKWIRRGTAPIALLKERASADGVRKVEVYATRECVPAGLPALDALANVEVLYV